MGEARESDRNSRVVCLLLDRNAHRILKQPLPFVLPSVFLWGADDKALGEADVQMERRK